MIHIIPILRDNYCYIVEGREGQCVIIDPGEASPVTLFLQAHNLTPAAILNTHHHGDHVAGNAELKRLYGIAVIGPEAERSKIQDMDRGVSDNDVFQEAGIDFHVTATPGHTGGHVVYYAPSVKALFSGDTLFSMGCGRLLEGTAEEMYRSLQKIKSLPSDTMIYCGHEYSEANGSFALTENSEDEALGKRMVDVRRLRQAGRPTVPVALETELATNPFLRACSIKDFAGLRARKDEF